MHGSDGVVEVVDIAADVPVFDRAQHVVSMCLMRV